MRCPMSGNSCAGSNNGRKKGLFTLFDALLDDPVWFLEYSLYRVPAVLIALILHECAHGWMAYRLGDPTAKMMGRLSLNPLRHLDLWGTILMIVAGFGWAKPVPVNPRYFKNGHRDDFLVSIAGITVNLLLFLLFSLVMVGCTFLLWEPWVLQSYTLRELTGMDSGIYATILMGYGREYYAEYFARPEILWVFRFCAQAASVNLYLAIFNLLPVPPLDGSHVFNDLLLKRNFFVQPQAARAGMAAVMLLSMTGILGKILGFLAEGLQGGLLGLISWIVGA